MVATSGRENVISFTQARADRRADVPVSLEMDWSRLRTEEEPWAPSRTIWVAVMISTALWAVIAGAFWFI